MPPGLKAPQRGKAAAAAATTMSMHAFFKPSASSAASVAEPEAARAAGGTGGGGGGGVRGSALVYCWKRADCETVARELTERGVPALPFHADLANSVKAQVQQFFARGQVKVVCATVAFGMGIDANDVRVVVHWTVGQIWV